MSNWKYNTKWNGIVFGVLNNMEWKIDLKYNAEWDETETGSRRKWIQ